MTWHDGSKKEDKKLDNKLLIPPKEMHPILSLYELVHINNVNYIIELLIGI